MPRTPAMALPRKCAIFPKVRKAYTISKSREVWSEEEHDKFLEALQLFDRDWKKIEAFVASKTAIQIRSHAQKYFLKVEKNGSNEHVPPPRPKRKAVHPYPQKASKIARATSQSADQPQSLAAPIFQSDPTSAFTNQSGTNPASAVNSSDMKIDFVQVYSFIGCVFDPNASDHLQRLKRMDPTNAKTVLLLMRNLSANLASPDFEEHRKVLFSYDVDREG